MGAFANMKDKARNLFANNADKVKDSADKTGEFVNRKTGGKYEDKVHKAQDKVREQADQAKQRDSGTTSGEGPGETGAGGTAPRTEHDTPPRPDEPGPGGQPGTGPRPGQ